MKNEITYRVWGRNALFTDPVTKIGGEKSSLQIPTPQSIKGITESIYWKPSIIWIVDEIRIMNPIQMEGKGVRPVGYVGNDLARYTYLRDVEYQVRVHFVFNKNRPELKEDWNENKHYFIALRSWKGEGEEIFFWEQESARPMWNLWNLETGQGLMMRRTWILGCSITPLGIRTRREKTGWWSAFGIPRCEKAELNA